MSLSLSVGWVQKKKLSRVRVFFSVCVCKKKSWVAKKKKKKKKLGGGGKTQGRGGEWV